MNYFYKSALVISVCTFFLTNFSSNNLPVVRYFIINDLFFLNLLSYQSSEEIFIKMHIFFNLIQNYTEDVFEFCWGIFSEEPHGYVLLDDQVSASNVEYSFFFGFTLKHFVKSIIIFLVVTLFFFYFHLFKSVVNSPFRIYSFFKNVVFVNLPFLNKLDSLIIFLYFFFSVYLLEIHFFFIFFMDCSSDSLDYQFNFLLSSFIFVFLIKIGVSLWQQGMIFSVGSFSQLFLNFYSGAVNKLMFSGFRNGFLKKKMYCNKFFFFFNFFGVYCITILFFVSTGLVWVLRFCIQFVRLLVLFIVHTVFDFVIVSSDNHFSLVNSIDFFLFKSFFFFFIYFFSFLYLIVYLNLMFTLQVFIFYFFSEIFQSNLIFDLSSILRTFLKK